ncbi:MAG: glucose-6-phosphate dehydrogenase assembly protein OpcA [Acidobacteriota bacterium]|nr:glucose-6-phosphate dehydrogenase assembly protein OpcA [Blastocatellia bacterium]MDW8411899.1 glucose-6-phosphate dehydrogenase assembly protein OpcA [Acidobacteriota bacterium]
MYPFDLKTIERHLQELWKAQTEENKSQVRACVVNLLIYDETSSSELNTLITDIAKHHPGRVLLMKARPNALTELISAEVSAVCGVIPGRGKQLCCEQVTIVAEGAAAAWRLAATVRPLLISDLPVILWWRGMPSDMQPFTGLLDTADKVILDTSYLARPTAYLPVVAELVEAKKQVAFADLNWSRLTTLRSHIAGLYDMPDLNAYIRDISSVRVKYCTEAADKELPPPQAVYLASWLIYRLDWDDPKNCRSISRTGEYALESGYKGRPIHLQFAPSPSLVADDLQLEITMAADNKQKAHLMVKQAYEESGIKTKLETPTVCWLTTVEKHRRPSEATLLSRELEILGNDTTYENVLRVAAHLVNQLEVT